mmetsp:Transcript_52263/g.123730  ORF Transcript_52263/g.123730 Transcript_52263/m.123730 type:complete len:274 (-) Transcript_52263:1395-2216(-)
MLLLLMLLLLALVPLVRALLRRALAVPRVLHHVHLPRKDRLDARLTLHGREGRVAHDVRHLRPFPLLLRPRRLLFLLLWLRQRNHLSGASGLSLLLLAGSLLGILAALPLLLLQLQLALPLRLLLRLAPRLGLLFHILLLLLLRGSLLLLFSLLLLVLRLLLHLLVLRLLHRLGLLLLLLLLRLLRLLRVRLLVLLLLLADQVLLQLQRQLLVVRRVHVRDVHAAHRKHRQHLPPHRLQARPVAALRLQVLHQRAHVVQRVRHLGTEDVDKVC